MSITIRNLGEELGIEAPTATHGTIAEALISFDATLDPTITDDTIITEAEADAIREAWNAAADWRELPTKPATSLTCPNCGHDALDANTFEAWCHACDWTIQQADEPATYAVIRTAQQQHLGAAAGGMQ